MKNKSQKLLRISVTIYLLIVSGTLLVNLLIVLRHKDINLPANVTKLDIIESVEREVDRSYSRFFTQFNFALFLIGTSVWVLRQSVINRLADDLRKEFDKDFERFKDEFKEKFESLTEEFEVQKEKVNAIERLSTSIPRSTYLRKFEDFEARKALKKLVTLLEKLDQSHPDILTIRDRILLGDGFYFLAFYYRGNSLTNNCFPNKGKKPSPEVSDCFNKAIIHYKKAIEDQPQAYSAWLGVGSAQNMLGQYDKAIQFLTTLIEDIESSPREVLASALVSRGLASRGEESEGELRRAISDFSKATKIDPQNSRAWYNKACYHALLNEPEMALHDLEKALELIPKLKDDAKEDSDFDAIRKRTEFRNLIAEYSG
jgi:tetratricopeptide (TPR) repeat protein